MTTYYDFYRFYMDSEVAFFIIVLINYTTSHVNCGLINRRYTSREAESENGSLVVQGM